MASKAVKVGILGICPVCEGEFKVQKGRLVHHGYQRPGDGMIHGDCFAVGYEPYERSAQGCKDYKALLEKQLKGTTDYIARIRNGEVRHFTELQRRGYAHEVVEYIVGVTDLYHLQRHVDYTLQEQEYRARRLTDEITRMNGLIANWCLKDLREVTEEMAAARTKAQRDARAAERAAKKAEKDAKAAALKAKRDAREAKREKAFQAFIDTLKALDSNETRYSLEERKGAASDAWYAFFSKKTQRELGDLWTFYYEFRNRNLEQMCVRLGLMSERDGYYQNVHRVNP